MRGHRWLWGLILLILIGCAHRKLRHAPPPGPAPFQQFVSQKIDWSSVRRVVVMPLANDTQFARAADEIGNNLIAEMQRAGYFDVVVATREDPGARAREIFTHGKFDELELLRIARDYDAQAILFGRVTQYHPYSPPRIGLNLLMVSPGEGVAIASADGLWDAREDSTARQAQAYQKQLLSWKQSLLGADRPMESPDVYQRFVCQQVAGALRPPNAPPPSFPELVPPGPMVPDGPVIPAGAIETSTGTYTNSATRLPPLSTKP